MAVQVNKTVALLCSDIDYLKAFIKYLPASVNDTTCFYIIVDDRFKYVEDIIHLAEESFAHAYVTRGTKLIRYYKEDLKNSYLIETHLMSLKLLSLLHTFWYTDKVLYLDDDCLILDDIDHLFKHDFIFRYEPYGMFDITDKIQNKMFLEFENIIGVHVDTNTYNTRTINAGQLLYSAHPMLEYMIMSYFDNHFFADLYRKYEKSGKKDHKIAFYTEQKLHNFFYHYLINNQPEYDIILSKDNYFAELYHNREPVEKIDRVAPIVHYCCYNKELKLDFLKKFGEKYDNNI